MSVTFRWLPITPEKDMYLESQAAVDALTDDELPPPWRMLLLGDASPTRVFSILTRSRTTVQLLDVTDARDDASVDTACPNDIQRIPAPRLRRRVLLRNEAGATLGYAVSWWNAHEYARRMSDAGAPIGASLATSRLDVYRDMGAWYAGSDASLTDAFGVPTGARLWGRHYVMYHSETPLALICEVFSPSLCAYLGPYAAAPRASVKASPTDAPSVPDSSAAVPAVACRSN